MTGVTYHSVTCRYCGRSSVHPDMDRDDIQGARVDLDGYVCGRRACVESYWLKQAREHADIPHSPTREERAAGDIEQLTLPSETTIIDAEDLL